MPLPETPGHLQASWFSLLWGHCSFLLGPGVHKVMFVPSKSLFPHSCRSSWWLMTLSSAHPQDKCSCWAPWSCQRPLGWGTNVRRWSCLMKPGLNQLTWWLPITPHCRLPSKCPSSGDTDEAVNHGPYSHWHRNLSGDQHPENHSLLPRVSEQMGPNEFWKPPITFLQ